MHMQKQYTKRVIIYWWGSEHAKPNFSDTDDKTLRCRSNKIFSIKGSFGKIFHERPLKETPMDLES